MYLEQASGTQTRPSVYIVTKVARMSQSNAAVDVSETHLSQHGTNKGEVAGPVAAQPPCPVIQRLFVMRHGERLDTREPSWARTAVRPYDTPITGKGKLEAFRLAQKRFTNKVLLKLTVIIIIIDVEGKYL